MKICGCGFANQEDAQACLACGAPLDTKVVTDTSQEAFTIGNTPDVPVPLNASTDQALTSEREPGANRLPQVYLILDNVAQPAGDQIVIPVPGGILGRAGDFSPEVFSPRVSGVHALIDFSRGRWFIKHLGRNKSYLLRAGEWIELPREQAVELLPGDRLRLADMLFAISISPYDPREASTASAGDAADVRDACQQERVASTTNACDQENTVSTNQSVEQSEERWVVTCPVCGAHYEVDSPDARVSECAVCLDALDKRRIASIAPKREVSAASDLVTERANHEHISTDPDQRCQRQG